MRGEGFERDAEKRNAAVMAGWRVLHFTPRQVKSGAAVQAIETLMRTLMSTGHRGRRPLIEIKDTGEPPYEGGIVRLSRAALCVDCERITEAWRHRCPCCGSTSLLCLPRILNRESAA